MWVVQVCVFNELKADLPKQMQETKQMQEMRQTFGGGGMTFRWGAVCGSIKTVLHDV